MRNTVAFIFLLILSSCAGVQFKTTALYDKYEEPETFERIEPVIFDDSQGTLWSSLEDCGNFEVTKEAAYKSNSSIKLSWDKNKGCDWIGFGNSFSNWAPTDMSQERYKKAFSMYVRTQEGSVGGIPIVLALEDAGEGGSYLFIDASQYLYGLQIDTTWKHMVVPLWHFPINEEEVDIYSIRQMKFQLEGGGSFFIDDLKLIEYSEEEYKQMRAEVEMMKPAGKLPQTVYTEGNLEQDAWAVGKRECHKLSEMTDTTGNTFIAWKYDASDCDWANWGINWNGWYQVNLRRVPETAMLKFRVKARKGSSFDVVLEDYRGHQSGLISTSFMDRTNEEWQDISIPLSDFELDKNDFAMDQIKQLLFKGIGSGKVMLDDIRITLL